MGVLTTWLISSANLINRGSKCLEAGLEGIAEVMNEKKKFKCLRIRTFDLSLWRVTPQPTTPLRLNFEKAGQPLNLSCGFKARGITSNNIANNHYSLILRLFKSTLMTSYVTFEFQRCQVAIKMEGKMKGKIENEIESSNNLWKTETLLFQPFLL